MDERRDGGQAENMFLPGSLAWWRLNNLVHIIRLHKIPTQYLL